MISNRTWLAKGLRDGMPIGLGYLAVAFTLGIAAKETGLSAFQAAVMSITNVTSAGEFAALGLIASGATLLELAITQLVINLRYCLMSAALSQKLDPNRPFWHRFVVGFGVTDEIFGVSIGVDGKLNPYYSYGMILIAAPGWAIGTFLGVVSGNVLPARIISALSVALFGMFIAVIIPPCKKNPVLLGLIAGSMMASLLISYLPLVKEISPGFRIIILTVVIAGIAAVIFPRKAETPKEERVESPSLSVHSGDGSGHVSHPRVATYLNSETN